MHSNMFFIYSVPSGLTKHIFVLKGLLSFAVVILSRFLHSMNIYTYIYKSKEGRWEGCFFEPENKNDFFLQPGFCNAVVAVGFCEEMAGI